MRGFARILAIAILYASGCVDRPQMEPARFFFVDHTEEARRTPTIRKGARLSAPITIAEETRRSLVPPLPSRLTFTVDVPFDPGLRFGIGVFTFGRPILETAVEFNLFLGEQEVFAGVVGRAKPNVWLDHEVDLSRWEGQTVRLTFETKQKDRARESPGDRPALALWGNPVLSSRSAQSEHPNVVLVSIDCLRADHVGAYGYSRDTTPRIDAFAADGVLFETAVSTSSWTLPTHMSMFTGLPPSIHGATKTRKLDETVPYLPEQLAEAGYRVDGLVSVPTLSQEFGFDRGFHTYRFLFNARAADTVDAAVDLLRRWDGQSHFLFLHLIDAHWPYSPPREFRTQFDSRPPDISGLLQRVFDDVPPRGQEEIDQAVNLYDGEIAYVDRQLGRFFDEMKETGLYESSLIVLTADHGEAFFEHGYWKHTQTLYEEMVRVPLIVKWPGDSPTGRVSALVSQVDVSPTVLAAVGLESVSRWARDLREYVEETNIERSVVSEVSWPGLPTRPARLKVALRSERHKYIATLEGSALEDLDIETIRDEELYDLQDDPAEAVNLAPHSEATLRSFRQGLEAYLAEAKQSRSTRRGQEVVMDELLQERLETLGYIDNYRPIITFVPGERFPLVCPGEPSLCFAG